MISKILSVFIGIIIIWVLLVSLTVGLFLTAKFAFTIVQYIDSPSENIQCN